LARQARDDMNAAQVLNGMGEMHREGGRPDQAIPFYEESIALFERLGRKWGVQMVMVNLAFACTASGDLERAAALIRQTLQMNRELGNRAGLGLSLLAAAGLVVKLGRAEVGSRILGAAESVVESTGGGAIGADLADIGRIKAEI